VSISKSIMTVTKEFGLSETNVNTAVKKRIIAAEYRLITSTNYN